MKKIISFKKDVIFKTKICEITSISLENTLAVDGSFVQGDFIINGEYKTTDQSIDVLKFSETLPFEVAFDPTYILDNSIIEIDDFYYEIINDSVLSVHIDVKVDNITQEEINEEQRCIEEETKEKTNILDNINVNDSYNTYKVYIIRENDTLEKILEKYNITKEELSEYNDLKEIQIGNKLIVPLHETD